MEYELFLIAQGQIKVTSRLKRHCCEKMATHTEEETMALMHQVFSMEEILEVILNHVASKEETLAESILPLRLVNKLWRKLVYDVILNQTKNKFSIDIWNAKCVMDLRSQISPDCCLPLDLLLRPSDCDVIYLDFLTDFAANISRVSIYGISDDLWNLINESSAFALPKLRSLEVRVPDGIVYYTKEHPAVRMVKNLSNANPLEEFKLVISLRNYLTKGQHYALIPSKVTSIQIDFCWWNQCLNDILMSAELYMLQNLYISVSRVDLECNKIKFFDDVLRKYSDNLTQLSLMVFYGEQYYVTLPLMKVMKTLVLENIAIKSVLGATAVSCMVPKLEFIKLQGNPTIIRQNLEILAGNNPHFKSLDGLTLNSYERRAAGTDKFEWYHLLFPKDDMLVVSPRLLQAFESLSTLILKDVSEETLSNLLPHVYCTLTRLKRLEINCPFYRLDFCRVLTGIPGFEVSEDESQWPDSSNLSICNLKCLEGLDLIQIDKIDELEFPPFIISVLLSLPNLKDLLVHGVGVDEDLKQAWTNVGRKITNSGEGYNYWSRYDDYFHGDDDGNDDADYSTDSNDDTDDDHKRDCADLTPLIEGVMATLKSMT